MLQKSQWRGCVVATNVFSKDVVATSPMMRVTIEHAADAPDSEVKLEAQVQMMAQWQQGGGMMSAQISRSDPHLAIHAVVERDSPTS